MGLLARASLGIALGLLVLIHARAASPAEEQEEITRQGQLITQLRQEKKWDELVQRVPNLIASFPNVPGFYLAYADALRQLGRLPEAVENYRTVKRLQPSNPYAYDGEAWALFLVKDYGAAEAAILQGMKVQPGFHGFLHTSLLINWFNGNRQLAFDRLAALEKLEPELARKVAHNLGMRGDAKESGNAERQLLDRARLTMLDRNPAAAISILAPLYFVEPAKRIPALLDTEAGDILLLAYAMNGDFVNMISLYGDLGRRTNSDEYSYAIYEKLSAENGAADQFVTRALVASVIVSSGTGRLHVGLQRGLEGLRKAKLAGLRVEDEALLLLAISQSYAHMGRRNDEARAIDQAFSLLAGTSITLSEQIAVARAMAGFSKFKHSDFEGAAKDFDDAISLLDQLGAVSSPFGVSVLLARAQVLVLEKKYDAAVERQRQAFKASTDTYSRLNRLFPKSKLSELGRSAWLSQSFGHFDLAVELLELAVRIGESELGPASTATLHMEAALASAYIRANKNSEARALLKALIPRIEKLRTSGVLTEEDRQQLFGNMVGSYKDYAWLLAKEDGTQSFEIAELAKARTLLESTLFRRANSSGLVPDADLARLREFENHLSQLAEKVAASRSSGKLDFAGQAEQQTVQAEYRNFRQLLLRKFPRYARLQEFSFPGLKAISSRLADDEILVSYLVAPKALMIYAVTRDGLRIEQTPISVEELRKLTAITRSKLSERPLDSDDGNAGNTLAAHVLLPIKHLLVNKLSIVIAPDDALAGIPFEALNFDGKRLIESFDISYSQSASVFFVNRENSKDIREHRSDILALGGAVYESSLSKSDLHARRSKSPELDLPTFIARNSNAAGLIPTAFESLRGRWEDLPGTKKEVEEVGALFPPLRRTVITGHAASEATLQELNRTGDLGQYKYLLFSAHGYLSLHEPALSAIVLSQVETTPGADGYVTASEWTAYNLRSELVVLSACDTGVGKVVQGEGVTGLPYALSVAGNRNTVMSLWPVVDDSTMTFMLMLFEKIRSGMSIPKSLSKTKREFLQSPQFSAPTFWAPFVMYGS